MRWIRGVTVLLALAAFSAPLLADEHEDGSWTRWRGSDMTGLAPASNPPLEWSENKNVQWKIDIPGKGSATPIFWDERLYVLTAISIGEPVAVATPSQPRQTEPRPGPNGGGNENATRQRRRRRRPAEPLAEHEFKILAVNASDGSIAWEKTAKKELPHENKQGNNSFASASAITDGEILLAYFGSRGLFCYDLDGRLIWEKDLGDMSTRNSFGEGSTPALHGETIVINWDHEGQSFVVALDKQSGEEKWRVERDEVTSWATPLVVELEGRAQVITTGTGHVTSYDLQSGEQIWQSGGLTLNAIPTPVARDGVVYVTSGYRGSAARAVRLSEAKGDITGTAAILWEYGRDTPYVPSPLLYGDNLYLVKSNSGILTNLDPEKGTPHYGPVRLDGVSEIYASPVGASDRVYILGRDGNAIVLKNGPSYEVLATNSLDDGFDASPVIVNDDLYLRGYRHLYKVSEEE